MPNWCDNSVTIFSQNKDQIDAIEVALTTEDKDFFSVIRPRPESEEDNWYDWNVNNWGTKWSPSVHAWERQDDNTIWVSFDSAWAPPTALYDYMHMNDYDVTAYYNEGGMGFVGKYSDGYDDYHEYDISDRESIEQIPEDIVDYADLMNYHEDWVSENADGE